MTRPKRPWLTASTVFPSYFSTSICRKRSARANMASTLSALGSMPWATDRMLHPVCIPQSLSRSSARGCSGRRCASLMMDAVSMQRCRSLHSMTSKAVLRNLSRSRPAWSIPCGVRWPGRCPCKICSAFSCVSPCRTRCSVIAINNSLDSLYKDSYNSGCRLENKPYICFRLIQEPILFTKNKEK